MGQSHTLKLAFAAGTEPTPFESLAMMTLESLKAHAEAFIAKVDGEFAAKWHTFMDYAEGKESEQDDDAAAKTLLESHGYTVTKP